MAESQTSNPNHQLTHIKGFWLPTHIANSLTAVETQFQPLSSDIILASFPKTGTTWLKALVVSVFDCHRKSSSLSSSSDLFSDSDVQFDDSLLTHHPHQLVPFLEGECFGHNPSYDIAKMKCFPRVFNTHLPYSLLPEHINKCGCKIVYISRNPMDTFVSHWHFFHKNTGFSMDDVFADFCQGMVAVGPYFDHVLEYWKASKEHKGSMLFLTYEELKQDPFKNVKKLAEFMGSSLSSNEIEQVVQRCSYERLSNLDVNKDALKFHWSGWDFKSFFRRGIVGDSKNYLTPEMVNKLSEIAREKWERSGLGFQTVDEILGSFGAVKD